MRTQYFAVLATLVAAFLLTASADAQPGRGGPGGPGGPGGRGGFGGGGGAGLLRLLRVEEVQKEIELLPDQLEACEKLEESLRPERGGGDRPNFREMSEADREKFMEQMRKEGAERAVKERQELGKILLPPQMERLQEVAIQNMGLRALANPEVAAKLKLSDKQKTKLQEVQESSMEQMREQMRAAFQGGNREGMRERFQEMQKKVEADCMAVLSKEQKKAYEELKGEPFEMPQPSFGGRGQGGRGQGAPGQGGRGQGGRGQGRPARPDA